MNAEELHALRELEQHLTATAGSQTVETLRLLSAVQLARRYPRGSALEQRVQAVRDAWAKASESDDYPQGFGWPGDLYDALEAL